MNDATSEKMKLESWRWQQSCSHAETEHALTADRLERDANTLDLPERRRAALRDFAAVHREAAELFRQASLDRE